MEKVHPAQDASRRGRAYPLASIAHLDVSNAQPAPPASPETKSTAMSHIGTSTSRVDGRAKVTGAAKYAAEYDAPEIAYGSVVTSTIAKGRIARIDTSDAMRVAGVLAVLTHENRPHVADNDAAYKDDAAPEVGSPFRPLYDDKVMFNGQPIALVMAEDWETARFAATLVKIEYRTEPHVTDILVRQGQAFTVEKPESTRQCGGLLRSGGGPPRGGELHPD